ncbi:MAG: hypothetical protein AB1486_15285 [Planctomycetota bacterium]
MFHDVSHEWRTGTEMRTSCPSLRARVGLSALELVLTVALMAVALPPLVRCLAGSVESAARLQREMQALDIARCRLDAILAEGFDEVLAQDGSVQSPPLDPLGRSLPQGGGFVCRVAVAWVSAESPAGPPLEPGSSSLLRVTVTVTWKEGKLELTALKARLVTPQDDGEEASGDEEPPDTEEDPAGEHQD